MPVADRGAPRAGWPPARVAEQLGVSRATVHKWLRRYREADAAGLADRSSRPLRAPNRTAGRDRATAVLAARAPQPRRGGAGRSSWACPLHGRTDPGPPRGAGLAAIDPITGDWCGARCRRRNRYEAPRPGDLIHVDVKKLGRIPAGGGWRLHGRRDGSVAAPAQGEASATTTSTPRSTTTPGWPTRSPTRREGPDLRRVPAPRLGLVRRPRRPGRGGCSPTTPWSTGAAPTGLGSVRPRTQTPLHQTRLPLDQRQSRTVQPHPAHRMGLRPTLDQQQPPTAAGLDRFLAHYNTRRGHSALGGQPPISRLACQQRLRSRHLAHRHPRRGRP